MEVRPKRKISSLTKVSSHDKNLNQKVLSPIEFFVSDLQRYSKAYSRRGKEFTFHCKLYRMALNPKRKIQLETKNSTGDKKLKLDILSRIEFLVSDPLPYGRSYSREDKMPPFHCRHYHMQINPKQKVQQETKRSFEDNRTQAEFFVYD